MSGGRIRDAFREAFGVRERLLLRSPGRVNLIGEHTDYNEGFVLPAAVDRSLVFAARRNGTRRVRLLAVDLAHSFACDLDALAAPPPQAGPDQRWPAYPLGVIAQLVLRAKDVGGFDLAYGGDLPMGAGMSSSAAVTCGVAFALDALFGLGLERRELAEVAQSAEHTFAGVRCGIMDQMANLLGRAGHALRIDCRDLALAYVPFPVQAAAIVVCESGPRRALAESGYNERRAQCEAGVAVMQRRHPEVRSLRDVDEALLEAHRGELDSVVLRRCTYVVRENRRVLAAAEALARADLETFGRLLFECHEGLRREYEASTPELDLLVDTAREQPGVFGARLMGAGFGGSTINVIAREHLETFLDGMRTACARLGLPDRMHLCSPANGTERIV